MGELNFFWPNQLECTLDPNYCFNNCFFFLEHLRCVLAVNRGQDLPYFTPFEKTGCECDQSFRQDIETPDGIKTTNTIRTKVCPTA